MVPYNKLALPWDPVEDLASVVDTLRGSLSSRRHTLVPSGISAPPTRKRLPSLELSLSDRSIVPERLVLPDRSVFPERLVLPEQSVLPERLVLPERPVLLDGFQDAKTTSPEYFVGVVPESHDRIVEKLRDSTLGVSYVSYPKRPSDDRLDPSADSSWVYRSWALSHYQLHIVLFEVETAGSDAVYVFCHHEPNWVRHPVGHLRQGYLNPTFGRRRTVELLEAAGLSVDTCPDIDAGTHPPAPEYCAMRGENA